MQWGYQVTQRFLHVIAIDREQVQSVLNVALSIWFKEPFQLIGRGNEILGRSSEVLNFLSCEFTVAVAVVVVSALNSC